MRLLALLLICAGTHCQAAVKLSFMTLNQYQQANWIQVSDNSTFDLLTNGSFTVSTYVSRAVGSYGGLGLGYVFAKGSLTNNLLGALINNSGNLFYRYTTNETLASANQALMNDSQPFQYANTNWGFALARNFSSDPIEYVNGVKNGISSWNIGTGALHPNVNNGFPFMIGSSQAVQPDQIPNYVSFGGTFSDFAVWNKALDNRQIQMLTGAHLKRLPLQFSPGNLIFYLPFDQAHDQENVGAVTNLFLDLSLNRNHGSPIPGTNVPSIQGLAERKLSYPPNE